MRTAVFSLLLTYSLAAQPARAGDLSRLDVAGVRIGMTADAAAAALAKHFGVPRARIKTTQEKRRDGSAYGLVSFDDGKTKCDALVNESPADGAVRVDLVSYRIPDTSENREAMRAAAQQKYGDPSWHDRFDRYETRWCADAADAASQVCGGEEMMTLFANSGSIILSLSDVARRRRAEALADETRRKGLRTTPKL